MQLWLFSLKYCFVCLQMLTKGARSRSSLVFPMPIGINEWRAGVGSYSYRRSPPRAFLRVSLGVLLALAIQCFGYLYLITAVHW